MTISEAELLCAGHSIEAKEIKPIIGSFNKDIFLVDNAHVLRPSLKDMQKEQRSFKRIEHLRYVPKMEFQGVFTSAEKYFYTILNMLPGMDFIDAVSDMGVVQQERLGASVSCFLNELHGITGTKYDIGHFVPLLPDYSGSWKNGHVKYWAYLREKAEGLSLRKSSRDILEKAFQFLRFHADVLDFQTGPVLLHNDFHPKNIIVNNGEFSGVIDWECSQFGEADFEMCHLIHWCVYPPNAEADFMPFLRSLFHSSPKCVSVPHMAKRLSIYQIEHELIQLIWSGGASETDRTKKLTHWIEGGVDALLHDF